MGKYFPEIAKAQEFLELKQGAMTVMDYVTRFTKLARFVDNYVATDMAKVRRFENGLKLSIRDRNVGLHLQDMDSMVGTTLTIERELGLEVETLEEPLYVSSPLGIRARIGMICRGCELQISGTTHSGPEDHGHVRVRCHPRDGLTDSLQGRYRL